MSGETHLKIGVCLGAITLNPVILLWSMTGSLLPDIDHPATSINKVFPVAKTFNLRHRGYTHTLLVAVLISLIVGYIFGEYAAIGMFMGYMSHIIADCLTKSGVAVFSPLVKGKIHLGYMSSNNANVETIIVMMIALGSTAYFGYTHEWATPALWSAGALVACLLAATDIKKYYLISVFILGFIIYYYY